MNRKLNGIDQEELIENISIGLTAALGVSGAVMGTLIPATLPLVPAIQAAAYVPALVSVGMKRLITNKRLSKKIEGQIKSCAENTAKEYLAELKDSRPIMYSLFRDVWGKDSLYDSDSTPDSIVQKMKEYLVSETKWEGYEITPKDINDVAQGYFDNYIMNMRKYPELNQANLLGMIQGQDEFRTELNSLKKRVDGQNPNDVSKEPDTVDFSDYYDFVEEEFTEEKDNYSVELLGNESDDSAYIEQFIIYGSEQKSALPFLSDWFDKKKYGTLLICGEPGHGKSLLCKKAVVEFKRGNFLKGRAQNVLAVSLNTGENPGIISGKEVVFENMLAWGPVRECRFTFEGCRGSLLFMDGFDEFIDEAKKANVKDIVSFIEKVDEIAKRYKIHIIVLSRLIAVQKDLDDPDIHDKSYVFSPITKEQQTEWVKDRTDYSDYIKTLIKLQDDEDMSVLLGIPLLFRMIVHTQYKKVSSNIVELYDGLFEHLMRIRRIRGDVLEKVRKDLSDHAYKVYCNDEDTAEVEAEERDENWVFAFYVKSRQGGNVGFFHRSFYQYFLARYILSRILDVVTDKQAEDLIGLFAERELDNTVRQYLSLLSNEENKKAIHNNLKLVIEALVRTEAYLNLKPRYPAGKAEKTKIGRTINVYRNTLHICAAFSYVIEKTFKDGIDVFLRIYPSHYITICSVETNRANLSGADLRRAYLSRADLSGADLRRAYLSGAYLSRADLSGANLRVANLREANLREAKLSGANLREADLSGADLRRAYLREADLRGADLRGADLRGADLSRADLSGADLRGADLSGANLIVKFINLTIIDSEMKDLIDPSIKGYETIMWEYLRIE